MSLSVAAVISGFTAGASLLAAIFIGLDSYVSADEFFKKITTRYPELANKFPANRINQISGPLRASYLSYLSSEGYLKLPDVDLQLEGKRIYKYLKIHAVLFTIAILSLLLRQYLVGP